MKPWHAHGRDRSNHLSNQTARTRIEHAKWRHSQETQDCINSIGRNAPLEPTNVRGLVQWCHCFGRLKVTKTAGFRRNPNELIIVALKHLTGLSRWAFDVFESVEPVATICSITAFPSLLRSSNLSSNYCIRWMSWQVFATGPHFTKPCRYELLTTMVKRFLPTSWTNTTCENHHDQANKTTKRPRK